MTPIGTTQPPIARHPWIAFLLARIGLHEVAGAGDNPEIVAWLAACGLPASMQHDATAWCGATARAAVVSAGLVPPHGAAAARNWVGWGTGLVAPIEGCIGVYERIDVADPTHPHGHVGFPMGRRSPNDLVLGGNESNQIMIKPYLTARNLWYGWPPGLPLPAGAVVRADP